MSSVGEEYAIAIPGHHNTTGIISSHVPAISFPGREKEEGGCDSFRN